MVPPRVLRSKSVDHQSDSIEYAQMARTFQWSQLFVDADRYSINIVLAALQATVYCWLLLECALQQGRMAVRISQRLILPLTDNRHWCTCRGIDANISYHHAPDEACRFSCYICHCYIFLLIMTDHLIILATKLSIRFIGICNYLSRLSPLPCPKFIGPMSDSSLPRTRQTYYSSLKDPPSRLWTSENLIRYF